MSNYAAPIEVVQAALHRVGEDTITDLDDGSAPALIATSNYEGIVRASLAKHAWSFATDVTGLTLQETISQGPWTKAYTFENPNLINLRWVTDGARRLRAGEYVMQAGRVLTLSALTTPQAVITTRANEGDWPDDFAEAIVVRMQALFLEGLLDRWQDARLKQKDSEGLMLQAILRDKRQSPGVVADRNELAEAFRGGRFGVGRTSG